MQIRFLAALIVTGAAWAQQPAGLDAKLTEKISASLKKSGAPSVSVAVVQDGKLAFAKAFGMADIAAGRRGRRPHALRHRLHLKQFTAAALLMLEEEGKLSLDDKVAKYLSRPASRRRHHDPPVALAHIRVRGLCSAGLHHSGVDPAPSRPPAILDRWAMKPLNFEPGTKWQYSNTDYVLAGEIFEKASGQGLVAFLKQTHSSNRSG